jgi:hypothetical protein
VRGAIALAAVAIGALAPAAEANVIAGRAWPGGRIPYAVTAKSLRGPVRTAALAWNRSGINVRFVEVAASKARVLITPLPRSGCFGRIGEAFVGFPGRDRSRMRLQVNCPEGTLTMTATHELGHVLGLGHEDRRCALMNSVYLLHCKPQPLEWEWYCSPPRNDDRRGALRLYGGRFRKAGVSFCVSKTMPGPVRSLGAASDPVDSLARVRLSFQTPSSASLRRVIITRRRGRLCGDTPLSQSVPIARRAGVVPRFGTLVAEVPQAARAAVVAVEDLAVSGTGTWCYAVFTLDGRNRWRSAGTRVVARGVEAPLANRIGLTAALAPAGVALTWTNPVTPLSGVQVLRAAGTCPASATSPSLVPHASAPTAAGRASFTDGAAGIGTWCYGLRFTTVQAGSRPLVALVQVTRA